MKEGHVSAFLMEVFRRGGMKRRLNRATAVLLWPRVVGPDVARFSTARVLTGGVLYVDVSDSETAMHLSMQRSRFLSEYRHAHGVTEVREIRFQVGRVGGGAGEPEAPPVEPPPPIEAVDPQELQRLARELEGLELPEEVAVAALQVGQRLLALNASRQASGWVPCLTCGALHDGPLRPQSLREAALAEAGRVDEESTLARELCAACYRYAGGGRVRAAARELKTDPLALHPELGEEEQAVAVHLAKGWLGRDIEELLPAATVRPAMLRQLELAARNRVALASGAEPQEVTFADIERYDVRVAGLLRKLGELGSEGPR